ncbi:helix-turn-helix domain-containing protein [Archaeoglobus neptunius]|uniref:hypothetical protein n=1 Tax=Archaeoglobus neptunius TaxID=2798580 RepID=UPI001928E492|nr:hypothetical protein [Archaeoglobus neptunius]
MKFESDEVKLIFKERAVEILMTIYSENLAGKDVYIQYIASRVNSPHSYVWLLVKKFEEAGLVDCEIEGRTKIIRLTDKGSKVVEHILEIAKELTK